MKTKTIQLDNKKVYIKVNEDEFGIERKKIILPEITDEELWERYKRIYPVVEYDEKYYKLKPFNIDMLRHQSFIHNSKNEIREEVNLEKAQIIGEFPCYHTSDYYGLFKPKIADVLQQFPDDELLEANAFLMSQIPENITDLNEQKDIIKLGCYKSKVKALILKK